uniref:Uncharacterized protein n=1 Tax=Aegilops tauschii TaxID=37682 RepID=N1R5C0_AEGTA
MASTCALLQVGQAVDEDPTATTKCCSALIWEFLWDLFLIGQSWLFFQVYKQQCNNSRNLHLNTALFSGIQISRLKSTSPHNLQPSTIMFCFMFYDQVVICCRIVKVAFSVGHMFVVLPAFFLTAHSRRSSSCNVEVIHAVGWMKVSTRLALWLSLFGDKKL